MTEDPKWITFDLVFEFGKTKVWVVRSKRTGDILGQIRWFGRWRQYSFYPEHNTVFDATCLMDITSFLQKEMENWRKEKRSLNYEKRNN